MVHLVARRVVGRHGERPPPDEGVAVGSGVRRGEIPCVPSGGAEWEKAEGTARSDGDLRASFSDIYGEHRRAVNRLACQLCGQALADEVAQDVFAALWQHPEAFDPGLGSLRSFLLMRCYGRSIYKIRSQSARWARQEHHHREDGQETVDAGLLHLELADWLAGGLAALPASERMAIKLAFYGQYTYRQAADILGEPEGTVKSRIRSGLKHLRDALDDAQVGTPAG